MAGDVEVLAAAGGVHPQLVMEAARVVAEEHVVAPFLVAAGVRVERARDVGLTLGVEFLFGTQFAAVGQKIFSIL